jgi:hypothetical protein
MTANATRNVSERPAERLVDVQRGAGGLRVLRDELRVGERGEHREEQRQGERGPDRAADAPADLSDERVDAAPSTSDHEEEQHARGDRHGRGAV